MKYNKILIKVRTHITLLATLYTSPSLRSALEKQSYSSLSSAESSSSDYAKIFFDLSIYLLTSQPFYHIIMMWIHELNRQRYVLLIE